MNVLSLFSGYGGLDMGLEMVFPEARTVCFVEIEPYAQKVLAKRFPGVPIWEDVYDLQGRTFFEEGVEIDVITAGFPCQKFSVVGQGRGVEELEGQLLWEIIRIAREFRESQGRLPMLFLENVPGLFSVDGGNAFGDVLGSLAEVGYDTRYGDVFACEAGAPHPRQRVWFISDTNEIRWSRWPRGEEMGIKVGRDKYKAIGSEVRQDHERLSANSNSVFRKWSDRPHKSEIPRVADGHPTQLAQIRLAGNGVVPKQAALALRLLLGIPLTLAV